MYSYKCLSSIQSKDIFHDNDLEILFSLVAEYVGDPVVLDKVCQYLRQFVSDEGIYAIAAEHTQDLRIASIYSVFLIKIF